MENHAVKPAPKSLFVSLDVGTHASGFAFSCKSEITGDLSRARTLENWPDAPFPYPKTRSLILYHRT